MSKKPNQALGDNNNAQTTKSMLGEVQGDLFPIPNPCIQVCESGPGGYCIGCLRSREERFNWPNKSVAERSEILKRLVVRRKRRAQQQMQVRSRVQAKDSSQQAKLQPSLPGFEDN